MRPCFGQPWKKKIQEKFHMWFWGKRLLENCWIVREVLEYSGFCMNHHVATYFLEHRRSFSDFSIEPKETVTSQLYHLWLVNRRAYRFCPFLNALCYFAGVCGHGKNERWHVGTYFVKCQGKAGRKMHKIPHNAGKIPMRPSSKVVLFPSNMFCQVHFINMFSIPTRNKMTLSTSWTKPTILHCAPTKGWHSKRQLFQIRYGL